MAVPTYCRLISGSSYLLLSHLISGRAYLFESAACGSTDLLGLFCTCGVWGELLHLLLSHLAHLEAIVVITHLEAIFVMTHLGAIFVITHLEAIFVITHLEVIFVITHLETIFLIKHLEAIIVITQKRQYLSLYT